MDTVYVGVTKTMLFNLSASVRQDCEEHSNILYCVLIQNEDFLDMTVANNVIWSFWRTEVWWKKFLQSLEMLTGDVNTFSCCSEHCNIVA